MGLIPSDVEAKTFKVVRRGYHPEAVREYLKRVGSQMSGLSERAKIAAVRAEQLEREILDVRQSADNVAGAYHDALQARRRMLAEAEEDAASIRAAAGGTGTYSPRSPAPVSEQHASLEAQQILAQARSEAQRKEAAAETVLQRALAASERIEEEMAQITADARAEADEICAQATRDADSIRHESTLAAAADRRSLEEEQSDLLRRIRQLQATLDQLETERAIAVEAATAAAAAPPASPRDPEPSPPEPMATPTVKKTQKKKTKMAEPVAATAKPPEAVDRVGKEPKVLVPAGSSTVVKKSKYADAPVPPVVFAGDDENTGISIAADADAVTVDLTDETPLDPPEELEPAISRRKPSRYKARSAKLPHLGKGAGSVLSDMASLRKKDS